MAEKRAESPVVWVFIIFIRYYSGMNYHPITDMEIVFIGMNLEFRSLK